MRYVFVAPHDWGDELVLTLMLYAIFAMAVPALRERQHTRIDLLLITMSGRYRLVFDMLLDSITLFTVGLYFLSGVKLVQSAYAYGLVSATSLALPLWVGLLVVPLSFGLCCLVGVELVIRGFLDFRNSGGKK